MRKFTLAGLFAVGFAVFAGIGCDDGKPKAAGEGGSPPAEDSKLDTNAPKGGTAPPAPGETPKGGGIVAPPKRGGKPPM